MSSNSLEMPFWDHLEELRWRLIKSILAIVLGAIISYNYSNSILYYLVLPTKSLPNQASLQVLQVTSIFTTKLSIAFFGGVILAFPIILFQFWQFISPAFKTKYTLTMLISLITSSLFFFLGICFAYFVIIPISLSFFTSMTTTYVDINYNYTLQGYLSYVLRVIIGCGLIFQFPIISIILTKIGVLTPEFLRQYRKYSIVSFLVLGAFLTPPDPISQVLVVLPLIILYEFSIVISRFLQPQNNV